jgi:hypothetical protein
MNERMREKLDLTKMGLIHPLSGTSDERYTSALQIQTFWSDFAELVADIIFQKLCAKGMPQKVLLTSIEAAWCLGFTERAFKQSEWSKEIPTVRVGIKKFYRLNDLEAFAANRLVMPSSSRG